jgi:hypothetical protein
MFDDTYDSFSDGQLLYRQCTYTTANPAVFTRHFHSLSEGDRVQFSAGTTMPTGISADTWYYVISTALTNDTFEIATTKAGSGVAITVAGSGGLWFANDRPQRLSANMDSTK